MLISEVLRILDRHDLPAREVAAAGEPFSALLSAQGLSAVAPAMPETPRGSSASAGAGSSLSPKVGAGLFPVGQRSYDNFLRALEESRKPRASHCLDLFQ